MTPIGLALLVVFVIGAGVGIYALIAPRRRAAQRTRPERHDPGQTSTDWNDAAAGEFSMLSEPARCDLVFAASALEDERSAQMLEHALDDPSEAVTLAAARGLLARGRSASVDRYLAQHPGERAARIAQTLALLAPEP